MDINPNFENNCLSMPPDVSIKQSLVNEKLYFVMALEIEIYP
jgi:hypothetical protein